MKTSLSFIFACVFVTGAFAGEKVGNGGKVVLCPNRPAEVLDYQRATREFGIAPVTDAEGSDEFAKAASLVRRIARINPTRAALYLESLKKFRDESLFLPAADFPTSNDTSEVAYCQGGRVLQAITQRIPMTSFEKRYTVNEDLWKELTVFQRAVLLVHEVALKEALGYGYVTADGAARMNVLILARDLNAFSTEQVAEVLLSTGLLYVSVVDTVLNTSSIGAIVKEAQAYNELGQSEDFAIPYASLDFFATTKVDDLYAFPGLGNVFEDRDDTKSGKPYLDARKTAIDQKGFLYFNIHRYEGTNFVSYFFAMNSKGKF